MTNFKANKKFTWFLVTLVLCVWGSVAYRIIDTTTSSTAPVNESVPQSQIDRHHNLDKYVYAENVRDPFQYVRPIQKDILRKKLTSKPIIVWSPPPFKLSGILVTKKKKTATLEGTNGSVVFLQEGDTASGVKILKIHDGTVSYYYQRKKGDWLLEKP